MTSQLALYTETDPVPITWDELLEQAACADTYDPAFANLPARGGRGGEDPNRWWPARTICLGCAVIDGCLAEALAHPARYTWTMMGGLTPGERRRLTERTPAP